ncbi:MAG: hypothetical protein H7175_22105 [Burkholderiales bacterium]|nr:hypothetical protein [Anaerolineae bacterium]
MMSRFSIKPQQIISAATLALMLFVSVTGAFAQDGEFNIANDDGRLNVATFMGGSNVYCVDATNTSATTYVGGGFRVLDDLGDEMLFVAEADITAAAATMAQTGQYVTLGVGNRPWYGGQPVAIYLLTSGEYQLNSADEYGKTVEFRWTSCRTFTTGTVDGCAPAWDRDSSGHCVNVNLY